MQHPRDSTHVMYHGRFLPLDVPCTRGHGALPFMAAPHPYPMHQIDWE